MNSKTSVTYDLVAKTATAMLQHGTKPSVRNVISLTGGKTETVAQYLREFHDKRSADVLRMADELGSSSIAKLLADEVQNVVDMRTATLNEHIADLTEQLNETIELLAEKEKDCLHRIELAEAEATRAIFDARQRADAAHLQIEAAEKKAQAAQDQCVSAEQEAQQAIDKIKEQAELQVMNAQSEANALVKAADKRIEKAENETNSLREQVKALSIDEAMRQVEKQQVLDTLALKETLKDQLSDSKANIARMEQELQGIKKDNSRLERDLNEYKKEAKKLPTCLAEINEANKELAMLRKKIKTEK